jgi:hypothetical protein
MQSIAFSSKPGYRCLTFSNTSVPKRNVSLPWSKHAGRKALSALAVEATGCRVGGFKTEVQHPILPNRLITSDLFNKALIEKNFAYFVEQSFPLERFHQKIRSTSL